MGTLIPIPPGHPKRKQIEKYRAWTAIIGWASLLIGVVLILGMIIALAYRSL